MKRLTKWIEGLEQARISCEICGKTAIYECWSQENCTQTAVDRLASIEDILGDDYDLDRLQELVEADKQGRVKIYPKSENSTCGACGHFHRIAGTRRGTCDVKPFATTRRGASWGYEFMASQSKKACKLYKPAAESALAKEGNNT